MEPTKQEPNTETQSRKGGVMGCFPLDLEDAWPTVDVIDKLVEAAEILLHDKNYDGHGWELISHAVDRGKSISARLKNNP